jgi:ACT domain-containing protein
MAGEIESRMNFIIEQQAQFTTDIQLLKERQGEMLRMIEAHSRQIESNTTMIGQLVDVNLSLARQLEEIDRRLGARMEELAQAQMHTDQRLDALIDTVDKLVRRNGP